MTDGQDYSNVLLVVLDSVRAANVPLYGYQRDTTPELRRFADTATIYLQARSPSNTTVPSYASLFTGYEAHQHGITSADEFPTTHTVFDHLRQTGYQTGLFTGNKALTDARSGVDESFDRVIASDGAGGDDHYGEIERRIGGSWYVDRLLDWVDEQDEPWGGCLTLSDATRPHEPRSRHDLWGDDEGRQVQNTIDTEIWDFQFYGDHEPRWKLSAIEPLYDGGIRQADSAFGALLDGLQHRGVFDETLIVVTADHGEGFGELPHTPGAPPSIGHEIPLHEVNVQIPLLTKPPHQTESNVVTSPATSTRFVSAVDAFALGNSGVDDGVFAPTDRPVVSSTPPLSGERARQARRMCQSHDKLCKSGRAVYVSTPLSTPSVTKYSRWGDEARELTVHGARAITSANRIPTHFIESTFGEFEDVDLQE